MKYTAYRTDQEQLGPVIAGEAQIEVMESQGWLLAEGGYSATEYRFDVTSQQIVVREPSLAEIKAAKAALVGRETVNRLLGGYTPQSGPLAGETLQTRESDQLKWLTSHAAYSTAVAAGQGAVLGADFRPQSNNTVTVTYAEGLQVLLDMAAWGKAVMNHSWSLKDAIGAAADQSALDAIDIAAGWP